MNGNHPPEHNAMTDTVCGTALAVMMNVGSSDLAKTVILAAVGAAVSYTVSFMLNRWFKK